MYFLLRDSKIKFEVRKIHIKQIRLVIIKISKINFFTNFNKINCNQSKYNILVIYIKVDEYMYYERERCFREIINF